MKKVIFSALRTFTLAALMPTLLAASVSCNEEEATVTPEMSVPDGKKNYFAEGISLDCSATEVKVAFQINVDWSMQVDAGEGMDPWCSVAPASGSSGLQEVTVSVSHNTTDEIRSARIRLTSGTVNVAEIEVTQEATIYEAVDLGLSVKWATFNVGAKSPEEYGGYYAWGETWEKKNYDLFRSKYYIDTNGDGIKDTWQNIGENISGTEYDVAHVEWGGSWRMPTLDEIKELLDKCSWEWTTVNGVNGQKVTGPSGNSIFLPAAGFRVDTELRDYSTSYWASSLYEGFGGVYANCLTLDSNGCFLNAFVRFAGKSVRPVTE